MGGESFCAFVAHPFLKAILSSRQCVAISVTDNRQDTQIPKKNPLGCNAPHFIYETFCVHLWAADGLERELKKLKVLIA